MEDYTSALKDYDRAIKQDNSDPYYWYLRADLNENKLKDNKSALADLDKCVKLDPEKLSNRKSKSFIIVKRTLKMLKKTITH